MLRVAEKVAVVYKWELPEPVSSGVCPAQGEVPAYFRAVIIELYLSSLWLNGGAQTSRREGPRLSS